MSDNSAILLYGGSFDPPHLGHLSALVAALGRGQFTKAFVIPTGSHAFRKSLTPYAHRLQMAKLAFGWLPGVEVSEIEAELPPPSYTLNTVRAFAEQFPMARLVWLVGADTAEQVQSWHSSEELCRLVEFFVVGRSGFHGNVSIPGARVFATSGSFLVPNVSSSNIRKTISEGQLQVEALAAPVLSYILSAGLYSGATLE